MHFQASPSTLGWGGSRAPLPPPGSRYSRWLRAPVHPPPAAQQHEAERDAAQRAHQVLEATHKTSLSLAAELSNSNLDAAAETDDLQEEVDHLHETCQRLQEEVIWRC